MSNKKNIVLGLDYSNFDGGITEVNRKMGLLDQEFKLASEMAKRYGDETDQLTLKQDQLTQKINLQNIKLEEAKKKYDAVASSNDRTNKKLDDADKALLKERITLEKLNNELDANKERLDKIALSDADRKMAILEQEFNLATEKAKAFGNESDRLTLKSNLLSEKITIQAQKVQTTKAAYDAARESGNLNEKQLDELYSTYLQNETALQSLNNELNENKNKTAESESTTRSFGDTIRSLASSLGIDVNPAVEALASKFDGISEAAGMAVLAIGTTITTLGKFTLSTAETAGKIDELAHKTGLTTDTIQEFNYAAEYLEISAEDIGNSIAKMTRNMDTARKGTGDAADAFRELHVRITENGNQLRDSEAVFLDTIDALGKVRNETEKDALSMAIFGRSAMDLNNLILEGSKGIKNYAKQAHEAGYVMDNETIVSFNNMDDAMTAMNKKFEAVEMKLGKGLLPVFETFAEIVESIPAPVLAGMFVFGALATVILTVSFAMSAMKIAAISSAAANGLLSASNTAVATTGAAATAGMAPLLLTLLAVAAVIAVVVAGTTAMKDTMSSVEGTISDITNSTSKMLGNAQGVNNTVNIVRKRSSEYGNIYYAPDYSNITSSRGFAGGTDDYPGGEAWAGEAGPERIRLPKGSQILSNEDSKNLYGDTYNFNLTVKAEDINELQKFMNVLNGLKQSSRQGKLKLG